MDNARTSERRMLRSFGLLTGLIIAVLFGLVLPWLHGSPLAGWPWAVAVPLIIAALVAPLILRGVYRVWMGIGHVLGAVNTRIVLGVVFFFVFTPVGVLMRIFGRDPLARRFEPEAVSYRVLPEKDSEPSMEVPF